MTGDVLVESAHMSRICMHASLYTFLWSSEVLVTKGRVCLCASFIGGECTYMFVNVYVCALYFTKIK